MFTAADSLTRTKIFLSHASEDKPRVLQIKAELEAKLPGVYGWIDVFEIVGGDSLLGKIADGMDDSEKFFIFLSPASVTKPWVQAELRRALTQEINGIKPAYIVPVIFGGLDKVPPFLEDKKYIDIDKMTAPEWVAAFDASIKGKVSDTTVAAASNLSATPVPNTKPGMAHQGQVVFMTDAWAEEVAFEVATKVPAKSVSYSFEGPGVVSGGAVNFSEMIRSDRVGYALMGRRLSPNQQFRLTITFPVGTDFMSAVSAIRPWDGSGATTSGTVFSR